jgi:hypothetical protein
MLEVGGVSAGTKICLEGSDSKIKVVLVHYMGPSGTKIMCVCVPNKVLSS